MHAVRNIVVIGAASLSFLAMTFTFLTTVALRGDSLTFWACGIICSVATAVVYLYVPETKGKSPEEISASLARGE